LGFFRLVLRWFIGRATASFPASRRTRGVHSIAQLCRAYEIPHEDIGNPNGSDFLAALKERSPDLIVSVACPYILKKPILQIAPLGCVNIHNAPLTKYKGMMPVFWQMYHGEPKIGITVHYMAPKVDEGAVLLKDELNILPGESLDHLMRRAKRHDAHCVAKVLRKIQNGRPPTLELNPSEGSYFTFPTREEIREFHKRGLRAIEIWPAWHAIREALRTRRGTTRKIRRRTRNAFEP